MSEAGEAGSVVLTCECGADLTLAGAVKIWYMEPYWYAARMMPDGKCLTDWEVSGMAEGGQLDEVACASCGKPMSPPPEVIDE